MKNIRFSIIGAGSGGGSMAAILANEGYDVRLHDINEDTVNKLNEIGKIKVTGKFDIESFPKLVTTDIGQVVEDTDVIMICTTTEAHEDVATKICKYLKDGQVVVLNPGHVGGALEVKNIFRSNGVDEGVVVAEAADLMYACRVTKVGEYFHSGIKNTIKIAAFPASDTVKVIDKIGSIFKCFVPVENILHTSLDTIGALLHPIPTLMNIINIDNNVEWDYYMEGVTPSIARLVKAADDERLNIAHALGIDSVSLVHMLQKTYNLTQEDLYELLQNNKAYIGVKSPKVLNHRFILEDTLCGTVPLTSIAKVLNVKTPILDAFVEMAEVIVGRNFKIEGRTAEKLNISGKTKEQIYEMIS